MNYRTHSGILDVASSVVDVIKRFFPQHIDPLKRERAFLPASARKPRPLRHLSLLYCCCTAEAALEARI